MSEESIVHTGATHWFSSDEASASGPNGWRLDVVTLLAVIGESSIAEHSQAITASMLCLLPRVIPAPQALLKGTRPARMPETAAKIIGVYSGTSLESVGFFANILHPLDELNAFGFRVLQITHRDLNQFGDIEVPQSPATDGRRLGRFFGKRTDTNISVAHSVRPNRLPRPPGSETDDTANGAARTTGVSFHTADVEAQAPIQGITRRQTVKDRMTDYIANPTLANNSKRPAVPAALWSPIHVLSVFSMFLTFAIIGFAVWANDGTAILSVSLISIASSIVGAASWWQPLLMRRSHTNKVPEGDVVIRTREGAFLIIKCTENVARELYAGTEECQYYVGGQWYKALMGFGTFLLMVSVILLGNCKWGSQVFIGASYISLNGLYWTMGLLPKKYFWDLSRYVIKDITPDDALKADQTTNPNDQREGVASFTRTLWYCIRETKRTAWVERSGAAPSTAQWRTWLAEAERAADDNNRQWPSIARKDELMKMTDTEIATEISKKSPIVRETKPDPAEQAVPAVEVQLSDTKRGHGAF